MMNFKLGNGSLYINDGDKSKLLGNVVECIPTMEFSADEVAPISWDVHKKADFSFEMNYINREMLAKLCNATAFGLGLLEYNVPVMTQARWYKKKRINKKWLKRYGMKPDTIKVQADVTALEMRPGHILDEQYDDSGICATWDSFDFEIKNQKYILRPDQKRKWMKIEW